jgi:hypothetical protein
VDNLDDLPCGYRERAENLIGELLGYSGDLLAIAEEFDCDSIDFSTDDGLRIRIDRFAGSLSGE